jgi:hypothetical protein
MLTEPIVEGAYYEIDGGTVFGPVVQASELGGSNGACWHNASSFVRRVYIVPTDPAEVVAELREQARRVGNAGGDADVAYWSEHSFDAAADLVAERLGVRE